MRPLDPSGDQAAIGTGNAATPDILSRVVLCLAVVAVYPRLYFGLEFFDEAYFLALPVAFSQDYQPFLDENAVHQFAALMTRPFIDAYVMIVGTTEGVVLFARHLYLACGLLAVWAVRNFWTRAISERIGNLLAAVAMTYVPLCIISLNYNSFTYLGLLAGSALFALASLGHGCARHMFIGTLCMAGVAFAYPTMLPVAGFAIAAGLAGVFATAQPQRRMALVWTAAAAVGSGALGGFTLLMLDLPAALGPMLEFSQAQGAQGGGAAKGKAIWLEFLFQIKLFASLAAALAIVSLGLLRFPTPKASAIAATLLWPALVFASTAYRQYHSPFTTVPHVLALLGLAAPALLFVSRNKLAFQQKVGIAIITSISALATVVVLWSTANGLRNAAIGLTPAALVTLACLAIYTSARWTSSERTEAKSTATRRADLPVTVVLLSLLLFQVQQLWTHAYREFVPIELEQTVDHGPWKGIKTTSLKIQFMNEMEADLAGAEKDAETIIFFDYFPAGYLMSSLRPRTPGLWLFPNSRIFQGNAQLRDLYAERLQRHGSLPQIIVKMICIPARPFTWMRLPEGDPVSALFGGQEYETLIERPCYSVARRRAPGGSPG